MPGQQGSGPHDPVLPQVSGQQPGQGGKHRAVSPVWPWPDDLTSQYRDLVPEDQDLHVLGGVAPGQEHQPAEHPDHEQVDETNEHERRA